MHDVIAVTVSEIPNSPYGRVIGSITFYRDSRPPRANVQDENWRDYLQWLAAGAADSPKDDQAASTMRTIHNNGHHGTYTTDVFWPTRDEWRNQRRRNCTSTHKIAALVATVICLGVAIQAATPYFRAQTIEDLPPLWWLLLVVLLPLGIALGSCASLISGNVAAMRNAAAAGLVVSTAAYLIAGGWWTPGNAPAVPILALFAIYAIAAYTPAKPPTFARTEPNAR